MKNVVRGSDLEKQIRLARKAMKRWPRWLQKLVSPFV